MNLLDEVSGKYQIMNVTKVADGEGGFTDSYTAGELLSMPMAHENTMESQKAEREHSTEVCRFLPEEEKAGLLTYHTIFKRVSDGQYFRVTTPSGENYAPESSRIGRAVILAEKWEMTS